MKFCSRQIPRPHNSEIIQTSRVFHRERKFLYITLEKAYVILYLPILFYFFLFYYSYSIIHMISDQYSSEKYVRMRKLEEAVLDLEAKEKLTSTDKLELKKLKKEIEPLKSFLDDAASHRKAIKAEIGMTSL